MSNHEHERSERSERAGEPSLEDALWGAEGGSEALVHDADEPGFDNREARDTLIESFDDPTDAVLKDELENGAAPKKKSNLPFYGAVGTFAVVALGLIGYKAGLIGGSPKKPIEPATVASAMASDTPKKTDSLIGGAAATNAESPDLLGGGASKSRSALDAEADLLSEKSSGPAPAPGAPAAPVLGGQEVAKAALPVEAPAPAAITPPPAATVAAVPEKPAPVAPSLVEVPKAASAVVTQTATAAGLAGPGSSGEPVAAAANVVPSKHAKPARVATAPRAAAPTKVAVVRSGTAKPVRLVEARKPSKRMGAGKVDKDATPESKEVLAGWKLRGTWPSHGPSQLAWIADENGRLTTVSVGTRVSGARVLSIGARGEVVQTTAGQILP